MATDRLTLRNVYLYLVCLITLVVSLFAAVSLVRSAVGLFYPDPGYYAYYEPAPGSGERPERGGDPSARRRRRRTRSGVRRCSSVVSSATTLLIAGPLYVYHWRRIQSELSWRNAQDVAGGPPAP